MHITPEGHTLQRGFNFYPRGSSQWGFRLMVRSWVLYFRYSKIRKRWFIDTCRWTY